MSGLSPLKAPPLRNPGESVDQEIRRWLDDRLMEPLFFAGGFFLIASMEWIGYLTHAPRRPVLFTAVALIVMAIAAYRVVIIRSKVRQLRLGRDGERCVGQFLERLRESGAQVFHDIPGPGFNLDHVVIALVASMPSRPRPSPNPGRRRRSRSMMARSEWLAACLIAVQWNRSRRLPGGSSDS